MIGRVIDRVVATLRAHWPALTPFALLVAIATTVMGAYFSNLADQLNAAVDAGETATIGDLTSQLFVGTVVVGMISAIISAVIFNMVADADATGAPDPGIAFQRTLQRLPSLIALVFIVGISVFIGLLLFVVPGIYLAVALFPAIAVLFLENKGAAATFARSRELVQGRWWEVFGVLVVLVVFSVIVGLLGTPRGVLGLVGGVVSATILVVVQQATILHLYQELAVGEQEPALRPPAL